MTVSDTRRETTVSRLRALGAVAVIRLPDADRILPVVEALAEGGVRAIEVTMTVPDALGALARLKAHFGDDVLLGVGSVLDAVTATAAVNAGARFVVSPVFDVSVVAAAHDAGAAAMPGAFTPTECQRAHASGADVVKVFPADTLGPAYFRAVLAPLPHLLLMPTGGVTLDNADEWLRAGAVAVGVGSALIAPADVGAGNYERIAANARRLTASIARAR